MPIAILLDTAVAILKRYRWLAIVMPLVLALGVSHCSDRRHIRQRDEARATVAQMELASKQARDAQIAANLATEARYRAQAEKADHAYQIALQDAQRASERYIAANRVRPNGSRSASGAAAPAEGDVAVSGDRSGIPPNMVAVTADDVRICTANTLRLEAVRDWGLGLKAEGLAD